ncbi:hypothetical protein ACIQUB_22205 [Rhizobium sp. NPDC090275]|uniref:hypothetical protein n=1 Tax=Rhizobium sp. NPDC090275 TaxID=3364498 RepID=UPI00383BF68B
MITAAAAAVIEKEIAIAIQTAASFDCLGICDAHITNRWHWGKFRRSKGAFERCDEPFGVDSSTMNEIIFD